MNKELFTDMPVYENGVWSEMSFETQEDFYLYLFDLFKEPGRYEFDETALLFNAEAVKFRDKKYYCDAPYMSADYIDYWDFEKIKNRKGVFYKNKGKVWYLTRDYYMWLNFLPINDKEQKRFDFAKVRDAQYHMALYEILAELNYEHAAIIKKRQIASSYYHCGRLINKIWFEETPILKLGAAEKRHVNEEGDWKFLEEYRNFLNENTAWYRPMNPGKAGLWQQQIEKTINGRKVMVGEKGVLQALTFDKAPEKGIGGPCHRKGTLILMADGKFKKVENILEGDFVLGIDNKPKKVNTLFRGIDYMYRVEQTRGEDYYTTGDHLLYLINRDANVAQKNKLRLTKTKNWLDFSINQKRTFVGVKANEPVVFYNNFLEPTLEPYFLGIWLGDGYRDKPGLIVNQTRDPEIIDYLNEFSVKYNCPFTDSRKEKLRYNDHMRLFVFKISHERLANTYITNQFIKYNLFYNKHIPDEFLYGSIETRFQLLAGVIDTDGHYEGAKGRFSISTTNDYFAKQLVFLGRSLGAQVRVSRIASQEHVLQGNTIKYSETNLLNFSFKYPNRIPTKIFRKIASPTRSLRNFHTTPIKRVTKLEQENYFGIEVEDSLYYLHDFTVSHNCTEFFYDEGGNAPTADVTYRYLRPAMRSGMITTGFFIIAGSVGELEKAEPLKKFIYYPKANGFYSVRNNLMDEKGSVGDTGLFIPEQWSMPPFIDKFGNSQVPEALEALNKEFERLKKDLSAEDYQLEVSQRPRNLAEAFAYREQSIFPLNLLKSQKRRIDDKKYPYELLDIEKDENGKVVFKKNFKLPIREYPITKNTVDKEGAIEVWERPFKDNPEIGKYYYGSIDPVGEGRTVSSDSLVSIYIYKRNVEVTKQGQDFENFIEPGKIVAAWCGRFDDINKTHDRLQYLLEIYGAWGLCENNISAFITHMIHKKKQHFLVPKNQIMFLKDLGANENVFAEYGWKNTGSLFKTHLLSQGIEFLKEEIDSELTTQGVVVKTIYGIERIPDIMLIKEMEEYQPGKNVDRLVAFCSLVAFVKVMEANYGFTKRLEIDDNYKKADKDLYAKSTSFFKTRNTSTDSQYKINRSPFKNIK